MTLCYRVLTPQDQPEWRELRLLGLKHHPESFLTTYDEQLVRPAEVERALLAQGKSWGAFLDGALVAMMAISQETAAAAAHRASVMAVFVSPAVQGRGIGRAFVEHIKGAAKARRIWQLELLVAEINHDAQRFYRRAGFREVGRLPNAALQNGVAYTDIMMVCDLRAWGA